MSRRRNLPTVLAFVALLAVLAGGLLHLFDLRLRRGDVYPAYSSLRADPLGAKALYLALDRLESRRVARNFTPLRHFRPPAEPTAFMRLGMPAWRMWWLPEEEGRAILDLVNAGGRAVIALRPTLGWLDEDLAETVLDGQGATTTTASGTMPTSGPLLLTTGTANLFGIGGAPTLRPLLGLDIHYRGASGGDRPARRTAAAPAVLPEELPWHGAAHFGDMDRSWRVLYERGGRAVAVERSFGRGTLVLLADSYLFSNEALRKDRQPRLLAWLVGDAPHVLFDETHLGVAEGWGIMKLARGYGLDGFVFGLLVLATLFVWRNATRLVPPAGQGERATVRAGRGGAEALVNLLRRNIGSEQILVSCLREWERASLAEVRKRVPKDDIYAAAAVVDEQVAAPPSRRDLAGAYRRVAHLLDPRRLRGRRAPEPVFARESEPQQEPRT